MIFLQMIFLQLQMQCVPHTVLFCFQIFEIVFVRAYFYWNIFNNFKAISLKSHTFCRIIGYSLILCTPNLRSICAPQP